MVDEDHVCCMCGDVGLPDKLFRCNRCRHRYQHEYCSNYYSEVSEPIGVCDWCQREERVNTPPFSTRHGISSSSKKLSSPYNNNNNEVTTRSEYSGDKIKQDHHREDSGGGATVEKGGGGKNPSGVPSPRPIPRRYKLLKDVMC